MYRVPRAAGDGKLAGMEQSREQLSSPEALMRFYLDMGVDETIGVEPVNRFAPPPPRPPARTLAAGRPVKGNAQAPAAPAANDRAVESAVALAAAAETLDDLRQALETFDGCALKKTATNLVFGDGNPDARIIFIGEAPGAEEDRKGLPFVGPSGQLLDRMLASIGLDRGRFFISNTVFWRPPGNRTPTTGERALCMPFIERMIELVDPEFLVAIGGPAATTLLAQGQSVGRLRGRWFSYSSPRLARPIEAMAIFHPAYLLRTPEKKSLAWWDLLEIRRKLGPD